MNILCVAVLCCFSYFFAVNASAMTTLQLESEQPEYSLNSQVEYLEDSSGKLDIEAIQQLADQAWKQHGPSIPNFGFTDSAYWFRLNISSSDSQARLLEVGHPLLDHIDVYLFNENRLLQQFNTGDSEPYINRPLRFRTFVMPLTIPANTAVTMYLRVQTSGSLQVPLSLWSEKSYYEHDEFAMAAIAIYFGIILSLVLYNMFLFIRVYEPAYLYYVLYVLMFGLFIAGLTGWGYKFVWPEAIAFQQYGLAIFIIMGDIFVCRFTHYFLELPKKAPFIGKLLNVIVICLLLLILLLPFTSYNFTVQVALVLTMLISILALCSGILMWKKGEIIARYFTIAWSALLIAVILASLEKFGVLPRSFWSESFLPIGMALEMILLSLALGERINIEKQERILAQEQFIALQAKSKSELKQKVAERTAELENANEKLKILATTDSLTGIFNRRHFIDMGTHEIISALRYQRPVSLIVLDIDHFKPVNDNYGHDVGDHVLMHIVSLIASIKRETDIFARLGGEEFALFLRETGALPACAFAERLRSKIEETPFKLGDISITLTVSQGIFSTGDKIKEMTIEQMIKQADIGLYRAKEAGRNRVFLNS